MTTQTPALDAAVKSITDRALRLVCQHPKMTADRIDAVSAAMKAAGPVIIDNLMNDLRGAPSVSMAACQLAALELAQAGINAIVEVN